MAFYPIVLTEHSPRTLLNPLFKFPENSELAIWAFEINVYRTRRLCSVIQHRGLSEEFVVVNVGQSLLGSAFRYLLGARSKFVAPDGRDSNLVPNNPQAEYHATDLQQRIAACIEGKPIVKAVGVCNYVVLDGTYYPRSATDYEDFLRSVQELASELFNT